MRTEQARFVIGSGRQTAQLSLLALFLAYVMLIFLTGPAASLLVGLAGFLLLRQGGISVGLAWPQRWGRALLMGVGGVPIAYGLSSLTVLGLQAAGMGLPDLSVFDQLKGNLGFYLVMVGPVAWGLAALGEELLFRGVFQRYLEMTGLPVAMAVLSQAVLFGLCHFYQGWAGVILTGVIGLFLGVWYLLAGRNLVAVILVHGLVDTISITALYLGLDPLG